MCQNSPFNKNHPRYNCLWRGRFLVYESFDTLLLLPLHQSNNLKITDMKTKLLFLFTWLMHRQNRYSADSEWHILLSSSFLQEFHILLASNIYLFE